MTDSRSLGEKYRLLPSQLNILIDKMVNDEMSNGFTFVKKTMEVNSKSSLHQTVSYFLGTKVINHVSKSFAIFYVSKDSATKDNEPDLPFIVDLIKKFREDNPEQKGLMLMPMRQCRGFFKLSPYLPKAKKRHIVLTEVDLDEGYIKIHDSQGLVQYYIYPDKLAEFVENEKINSINLQAASESHHSYRYEYCSYGTQPISDNIVCGYYVHQYLLSILEHGHSNQCKALRLNILSDFSPDKVPYIQYYIPDWQPSIIDETSDLIAFEMDDENYSSKLFKPTQSLDSLKDSHKEKSILKKSKSFSDFHLLHKGNIKPIDVSSSVRCPTKEERVSAESVSLKKYDDQSNKTGDHLHFFPKKSKSLSSLNNQTENKKQIWKRNNSF